MYNFLDPKLMPKVSCDCLQTDNYEAENLLAANEAIRSRGFLAYTITKPPILLDFTLICPVNIAYIYLNAVVGKQKTTGVELFVKCPNGQFISVGKAVFDTSSIVFCNSRRYSQQNHPDDVNCEKMFYFKSDTYRFYSQTETLRVVIFRTDKSVPCIGSIKVYGEPSARKCSKVTKETIDRLMNNLPATKKTDNNEDGKKSEVFKVPSEFVDDLTCEIMAIPMTLPSGKTIDRETLEKHVENEKIFGRKPGDPFTGLKFSETRKPILNTALKTRIDMFLMRNASNPITFGLKRTIGSNYNSSSVAKRHCAGGSINLSVNNSSIKNCTFCKTCNSLYLIPCKHFVCRECLTVLNQRKCNECNKEFSTNEIEKVFVT